MLQLKRISQEQVITIDKYGYTKYINKKKPTKVDTIEFKNLGEIRFHTYVFDFKIYFLCCSMFLISNI